MRPLPCSITASRLLWNSAADKVFPALRAALDESPVSLGSWTTLSAVTPQELASGEDISTFFEGQLIGTPGELRRLLAPAYAAGQPDESTIKEMDYWDVSVVALAALALMNVPLLPPGGCGISSS